MIRSMSAASSSTCATPEAGQRFVRLGRAHGSIGVVTVNAARLRYMWAGDEEALYDRMTTSWTSPRPRLRRRGSRSPSSWSEACSRKHLGGLGSLLYDRRQRVNEAIRNFTHDKEDITTEWGHAFPKRLLAHMRAPRPVSGERR